MPVSVVAVSVLRGRFGPPQDRRVRLRFRQHYKIAPARPQGGSPTPGPGCRNGRGRRTRPRCPRVLPSGKSAPAGLPFADTDTCLLTARASVCYARYMSVSDQELLHHLSRMPFVDTAELAMILGEAHVTIHRGLAGLLDYGIVGRVSHGTAYLSSSNRYYLTAKGIREAAGVLGFDTPSDFVRAYPVSREWLTLLIRRMDAVATVYRLAASLSPGTDGLRTQVDFHRRGRFDATITRHDGRSFGVVRQGPALRRRSLFDRLRAIAEYGYRRRPGTVLVLTPSVWEQGLTTRFCEKVNLEDAYVAVESRESLEDWNSNAWRYASWVFGSLPYSLEFISTRGSPNRVRFTEPPERKRASLPDTEHMVSVGADLRPNPVGEEDAGPDHRSPDDSPGAPGPLAGRLRGKGQPDAAQSRECLGAAGAPGASAAPSATPCRRRAYATSPTGTGRNCRRRGASGAQS